MFLKRILQTVLSRIVNRIAQKSLPSEPFSVSERFDGCSECILIAIAIKVFVPIKDYI